MAIPVLIIGRSGSGKSTSLRSFSPEEVHVINVMGKPLPFRTKLPQTVTTSYKTVCETIRDCTEPSIVIDDAGYLITDQFMQGHSTPRGGSSVFDLYNDIADSFYRLMRYISTTADKSKIVYLMMHPEMSDDGYMMPQTVGKLLNEKVNIPGLVSVCIYCDMVEGEHVFHTCNMPNTPAKRPPDMDALPETMPNDLKAVDAAIRDYWGLVPLSPKKPVRSREGAPAKVEEGAAK